MPSVILILDRPIWVRTGILAKGEILVPWREMKTGREGERKGGKEGEGGEWRKRLALWYISEWKLPASLWILTGHLKIMDL